MKFEHPGLFAVGLVMAIVAAVLLRPYRTHSCLWVMGLLLIATAAGGPIISLHPAGRVVAMVDLSPSTRGATFRDRGALMSRIGELVGKVPVEVRAFSDHVEALPAGDRLPDIDCEQTRYSHPAADAILLFSDGRFSLPEAGAPTYPLIDPLLIDPADAQVKQLDSDGGVATAEVENRGGERDLNWVGTDQSGAWIAPGPAVIQGGRVIGSLVSARLNQGDLWPENDSLAISALPPENLEYWWVGAGIAPAGWIVRAPADLPVDPSAYLQVGAIALSNVAEEDLSQTQQERLAQYVRDLGGTLLIFGGNHAFAASGYGGTALDSLSPLASDPPSPTTHWMLIVDSSGSMAEPLAGRSRWAAAVEAMIRVLPLLPPKDVVSVGSFARDLAWWVDGEAAMDVTARLTGPPGNVGPNGPTNLQAVLEKIAARNDPMPCEVLLLTDADTTIDDPAGLAAKLFAAKVRVSLLGLGDVAADNPVVRIVNATGGHWSATEDPSRWIESLEKLMRSASPSRVENTEIQARFDPSLNLPARSVDLWNRTWLRAEATEIVSDGEQVTLGARWRVGAGTVGAFAFAPTMAEATSIAATLAAPPRDPRFKVSWRFDAKISVSVDASNEKGYLNGLSLVLKLGDRPPLPLAQTGPGMYSLEIPAVRSPMLATVQLDGYVIDRRSVPGRYAPEFEAIGNDDRALAALAARTGGKVIGPRQHSPIDFAWPVQQERMDSYFAAAGALLLAAGTVMSRYSVRQISASGA